MNNKKIRLVLSGLVTSSFIVTCLLMAKSNNKLFYSHAINSYNVTLNKNNTTYNSSLLTYHHNENHNVIFSLSKTSRVSNELITLNEGGYMETYNITSISGITVTSTGDVNLSYRGGSATLTSGEKATITSSGYIKLSATSEISISNISFEYECVSNDIYDYVLEGDNYVVSLNDKTLYHYDIPQTHNGKNVIMKQGIFEGASNITSISVPTLNGQVFPYYWSENALPSGYPSKAALVSSSLKNVEVKAGDIPNNSFRECSNLESITLLDTSSIGEYAFYNTNKVKTIYLNDGITDIGRYSFEYMASIKDVFIPSSVTTVGRSLFNSNSNLVSIRCGIDAKPSGWNADWYGSYSSLVTWSNSR